MENKGKNACWKRNSLLTLRLLLSDFQVLASNQSCRRGPGSNALPVVHTA
jgi:hypothetical protein